jgi:hypothetical protein
MIDKQIQEELNETASKVRNLNLTDLYITDVKVFLDQFCSGHDVIDVELSYTPAVAENSIDLELLFAQVRDVFQSDGWEYWVEIHPQEVLTSPQERATLAERLDPTYRLDTNDTE